jgi:hypothetical protein
MASIAPHCLPGGPSGAGAAGTAVAGLPLSRRHPVTGALCGIYWSIQLDGWRLNVDVCEFAYMTENSYFEGLEFQFENYPIQSFLNNCFPFCLLSKKLFSILLK